jgi:hypothetical protein
VTYWGRDKDGNPTGVGYEVAWMPVYVKIGVWQPEGNWSGTASGGRWSP